MSSKAYDISLIKKYLHGELDTRSMYRFERTSQDDPFLMDALDGYYIRSDQQANIEELKGLLHSRIQRSGRKIFMLWPLIGAIIAVLAFAAIGVWLFTVYLPDLKKGHKQLPATVNPADVNPQQNRPDTQARSFVMPADADTARIDTSAKAKKDTLSNNNVRRNPTKGSVEASTVIADLNRLPYSTAKKARSKPGPANVGEVKTTDANVVKTGTYSNGTGLNNRTTPPVSTANNLLNNVNGAAQNASVNNKLKIGAPINNNAASAHSPVTNRSVKEIVTQRETGPALNASAGKGPGISAPKLSVGAVKGTDITSVSGIVVSADNGKPLAGVALRIMGTQQGTITDANGRFNIRMSRDQVLQANFVGYYGKQVATGSGDVKILLQPIKDTKPEATNSVINNAPTDKGHDNALNVTNPLPSADITTATVGEKKNLENVTENVKPAIISPKNNKNTGSLMRVGGRVIALATNYPVPKVVMWNKNANEQYRLLNDGVFDIVVHKGDEIFVGHPGYKTQKVKIRNSDHMTIVLEETTSPLYDGFVRGLSFEPYDDTTHPQMGWNKFKILQKIRSADGKTGTIKVDFTVNTDNTVTDLKISKSVSAPADSQAMAIVKNQVKWVHNTNNQPEKMSVKFKVE